MSESPNEPAELAFSGDAQSAPADWESAEQFPSLRAALEAAVDRMDQHPWIRVAGRIIAPPDVDDLWKETFRARSD
jgi:hypothetical protein